MPKRKMLKAVEALAESWASIDGKLDKFNRGREDPKYEEVGGYYGGYMCEAEEAIRRLEKRGYTVVELEDKQRIDRLRLASIYHDVEEEEKE